jgi:phospholipid/cholesterol/gamma-HCH transport system substrate-binding protein
MTTEQPTPDASQKGPSDRELDRAGPAAAGGREVRIGIFVLIGILSTLMVLFLLTDPATFRGRYMVMTQVDDAGGVRKGDPVQMMGVNIGRVHDFGLREGRVDITLEVDGRWDIPVDSRTRLTGVGLLGGRTVEVVPGSADTYLRPGERIPGESGDGMMELADVLGADLRQVLTQVRTLLSDTTVAAVQESVVELERLLTTMTGVAEEQRGELLELSRSLSRSAARVEEITGGIELEGTLARADSTVAELRAAGENLTRATSSLEEILARLERGEGTLGQLSTNDELYRNLSEAAEAITLLARDVQQNPGRYIRLRIF